MTALIIILSVLAFILISILVLWLLLPKILVRFIFHKPKRSTKIPEKYVGTPHYNASQNGLKFMRTLPNDNIYIKSFDGLKLHAYFFPEGDERKKFVIGIHGYKSYSRPEFAPYIEFYRSEGYNVVLPDDRAHAPSEGEYLGFGVLDRIDCISWAKYLVRTYGDDIEILLHGVSMGGATVVSASGDDELPKQVKGIVADCAFSSGEKILEYELKDMAHLPSKKILPRLEKILVKKAGYNLHENTAISLVKNAKVPILFIHGKCDTFVPPEMATELYEACPTKKKLLMVEKAGHAESIAFAPEDYKNAIKEMFFDENNQ